jgi:hypothetical protein
MALMGSMIGIGVFLAKQGYITDEQFNKAKGSFESLKTLVIKHVGEISGHVDSVTKGLLEFVKTHLSKKDMQLISNPNSENSKPEMPSMVMMSDQEKVEQYMKGY